jgi:hypothetical protein
MHSALLVRHLESLGSIHLKPNRLAQARERAVARASLDRPPDPCQKASSKVMLVLLPARTVAAVSIFQYGLDSDEAC